MAAILDDFSKCIFWEKMFVISALVQACRQAGNISLLEPMTTQFTDKHTCHQALMS